jgi:hypothetical protein
VTELEHAYDDFVTAMGDAVRELRAHRFYADPTERAAAHGSLTKVITARIEEHLVWDPDFPWFRVIDRRTGEGADNADQRYLVARVTGGAAYRVWGTLGSARRLEFQTYCGHPYLDAGNGRSGSFLTFEDLDVAPDGSFEVHLTPERVAGNWLENPSDASKLFVRQIYSEWSDDPPGEVHIDRIDTVGTPAPALTDTVLAERLRAAAADLRSHAVVWPDIAGRILDAVGLNRMTPPHDSGASGGVPGRWMANGIFELHPGDALIVRTWPAAGNYQGIQLLDVWMVALEYADRQTSLTADQAVLDADGAYRFVVCAEDPGVANWLDTLGRRRGVVILRYDGCSGEDFDPAHVPTVEKVAVAELREHLTAGTRMVTAAERAAALAARRRHVQVRFGV